jgi:glycosyltransferase involved in cell wall biosynthesis
LEAVNPSGRIRVLHLIEALGSGGAERLLFTNLKHLDEARFQSEVVTVFSRANHWREPIEALGVPVSSLECRTFRDIPAGIRSLRRGWRAGKPDLIHTHLFAANAIGRLAGRLDGIPVLSSIHNPDHDPETFGDGAAVHPMKRRVVRWLDQGTARVGCERLLAVSEFVRQSAHRRLRFPLDRIELLYNPIDAEQFCPDGARPLHPLREELGLSLESKLLLNVARLSPQKGLLHAIRALPAIRAAFPAAHLVSVGATTDDVWFARLRAEAVSLGVADAVHFLGIRRDIPDLLRACDLFVFPSLYEGLGISLIEAMASGCACVASATGPVPEVIEHGVTGWLTPPASPDELAAAAVSLLRDDETRRRLGQTAAVSVAARFHPAAAARKLEAIYESVLR